MRFQKRLCVVLLIMAPLGHSKDNQKTDSKNGAKRIVIIPTTPSGPYTVVDSPGTECLEVFRKLFVKEPHLVPGGCAANLGLQTAYSFLNETVTAVSFDNSFVKNALIQSSGKRDQGGAIDLFKIEFDNVLVAHLVLAYYTQKERILPNGGLFVTSIITSPEHAEWVKPRWSSFLGGAMEYCKTERKNRILTAEQKNCIESRIREILVKVNEPTELHKLIKIKAENF